MSAKRTKADTGEARPAVKGDLSKMPKGSFTVDGAKNDVYRALYDVLDRAKTMDD